MMDVEEIQVVVPWGQVSGKLWGKLSDPMVLTFHGVMDNAGSFDRLIPFLPNSFCYACFDLPGHGRSSHFPPYLPIYTLNYVVVYKLIVEHFKRQKYIIMGHSYGGQIGFLYTQLYPNSVEKLVLLDTIHSFPVLAHQFGDYLRDKIESITTLNQKLKERNKPTYTYDQALKRLQSQRFNGGLSEKSAEALLSRALEPVGDGKYAFAVDQRLRCFINPIHDFRYIIDTFNRDKIKCPMLIVLGSLSQAQQIYMKSLLEFLKKRKNVKVVYVVGDHDVHNETPEIVAPHLNKFLLQTTAKL